MSGSKKRQLDDSLVPAKRQACCHRKILRNTCDKKPKNTFEKKLLKLSKSKHICTSEKFKAKILKYAYCNYHSLKFFGEIVYDPNNTNLISMFGNTTDLKRLRRSIQKYFLINGSSNCKNVKIKNVRNVNDIVERTEKQRKCCNDVLSHTQEQEHGPNPNPNSNDYYVHLSKEPKCDAYLFEVIHNNILLAKILLIDDKKMNVCMENLNFNFLEESLVHGIFSESVEYYRNKTISLKTVLKNIEQKCLTFVPIRLIKKNNTDLQTLNYCISHWMQYFKKLDGWKFTKDVEFFDHLVLYQRDQIFHNVNKELKVSDLSVIISEYLSNSYFESMQQCICCKNTLHLTNEYPFIVRLHNNEMIHGYCIQNSVNQILVGTGTEIDQIIRDYATHIVQNS